MHIYGEAICNLTVNFHENADILIIGLALLGNHKKMQEARRQLTLCLYYRPYLTRSFFGLYVLTRAKVIRMGFKLPNCYHIL